MSNAVSRPFHSAVIDGEEITGVAFSPSDGRFYEFIDPEREEHDHYLLLRCPRTGEERHYASQYNWLMARLAGGITLCPINAERWASFREEYVNAPDEKHELWSNVWKRLSERRPRP